MTWLVCAALPVNAAQSNGGSEYEHQLKVVPDGPIRLAQARGVSWAEYCPDQTCDVIRTRRPIDRAKLAGLALSYYFYVSEYSYLRPWKEDEQIKKQVDVFLESQAAGRCDAAIGRGRSICALRLLADAYKVEILFVRHDERKTTVQRLSPGETIK